MKILIGVDDSAHSKAALAYVKSMKWQPDTKFMVLSAARSPALAHTLIEAGGVTWVQEAAEQTSQDAEELTSRAEQGLRMAGLTTEARVIPGDPREALVDMARGWGADLIVVGSHGRSGLEKLLMGSVATHVVTHAPCSVLVVKLKK